MLCIPYISRCILYIPYFLGYLPTYSELNRLMTSWRRYLNPKRFVWIQAYRAKMHLFGTPGTYAAAAIENILFLPYCTKSWPDVILSSWNKKLQECQYYFDLSNKIPLSCNIVWWKKTYSHHGIGPIVFWSKGWFETHSVELEMISC